MENTEKPKPDISGAFPKMWTAVEYAQYLKQLAQQVAQPKK